MASTLLPPDEQTPDAPKGHGTAALGPSDSSDSGSDMFGAKRHEFDVDSELDAHALETGEIETSSDTDRFGTGERASADGDANLVENADIEPDRLRHELSDRIISDEAIPDQIDEDEGTDADFDANR
jgi:hypothetical protein